MSDQATPAADPKFPHIYVPLNGEDGNAMFIIGRATRAMKREGVPQKDIDAFVEEAMGGDYNNVLRTVMRWVATS